MTEENQQVKAIDGAILLGIETIAEQEIKDLLCKELPIAQKHITVIRDNLKAKGLHPIRVWVLGWVINILIAGQTALSCPVPQPTATN
jgi:hypothetical protein